MVSYIKFSANKEMLINHTKYFVFNTHLIDAWALFLVNGVGGLPKYFTNIE